MWESNRDRRSTKSNDVPLSYLGSQYHAVHKAITICCSSTEIFTETRNTFCGTWYLPHSRVHKSMIELCA